MSGVMANRSFMGKVRAAPARAVSSMPLKMGLFDGIAKAMNEAMANDPSLGKPQNPGFREGYDGPEEVTVTFLPSGVEVASYQGELLTDVCRRANVEITYGCQKGTCGACEVDVKSASAPGGFGRLRVCESVTTYEPMEIIILDKVLRPPYPARDFC